MAPSVVTMRGFQFFFHYSFKIGWSVGVYISNLSRDVLGEGLRLLPLGGEKNKMYT